MAFSAEDWTIKPRAAQGLGPKIEDEAVISRIKTIAGVTPATRPQLLRGRKPPGSVEG